jgi:hypothetical protein
MRFTHPLVGFPFGAIVRNALRLAPAARAALWIREDRVSAHLVSGSRAVSFAEIGNTPGAPLLSAPPGKRTAFAAEVLRPNRAERDGRFAFLLEHPDAVLSLVQTKNLAVSSIGELCRLPVEMLLPTPNLPDSFLWELLSPELDALPASGDLPSSVVVVGLPQQVCWWAEKWVESVDGSLMGVWPAMLAILHWCRLRTPAFALLPGRLHSYLAVFVAEKLHLLRKLSGLETLQGMAVESLVEEIRRELHLPPSPTCIYPGEIGISKMAAFLERFQNPCRVLGPIAGSSIEAPDAEMAVLQHTLASATL